MADINSPIKIAHKYWKELIKLEDTVVDATLGNGQDALFLTSLCKNLIGIDIQEKAILTAKELLKNENVHYILGSHVTFPAFLKPESVKLIVYNLGYLPRGDKSIVTKTETTLQSIQNALPLIQLGGAISITCYSGHEEGAKEEDAIIDYTSRLEPRVWCATQQRWLNRLRCPSLVLLNKLNPQCD